MPASELAGESGGAFVAEWVAESECRRGVHAVRGKVCDVSGRFQCFNGYFAGMLGIADEGPIADAYQATARLMQ